MIVLAELYKEQPHDHTVPELIRETLAYGQAAVSGTTISFEFTKAALGDFLGNADLQSQQHNSHPQQQHLVDPNNIDGGAGGPHEIWDLPQMEDLFSGAFTDPNYRWYA